MKNRVERLLNELNEKKLFYDEAVNYLKNKGIRLNREESLELIEKLIEQHVFLQLPLIGYLLEKTASPDLCFFNVFFKVIEKIEGDTAQEILIQHLIQIGKNQPKLAINIYEKLQSMKQPKLLLWGCWMLGGAGKVDFREVSEVIRDGVANPDPETKVASLIALRISFEERLEPQWKDFAFSLLEIAEEKPNEMVKRELVYDYFFFYDFDQENVFLNLRSLPKREIAQSDLTYPAFFVGKSYKGSIILRYLRY